jgi:hypothetical protein
MKDRVSAEPDRIDRFVRVGKRVPAVELAGDRKDPLDDAVYAVGQLIRAVPVPLRNDPYDLSEFP